MEEILREHAGILRSMADELDAVADAMMHQPVTSLTSMLNTPTAQPQQKEATVSSATYTVSNNINMSTVRQWADSDLVKGYKVFFKDALTGHTEEYFG